MKVDNSKAILNGVYSDATVTVPANTTYEANTILGFNSTGKLTAFTTDNNVAGTSTTSAFEAEPSYILAHPIANETSAAIDYPLARVLECGEVDIAKAVFIKAADATDAKVIAALKNNGIRLVHVDYAN